MISFLHCPISNSCHIITVWFGPLTRWKMGQLNEGFIILYQGPIKFHLTAKKLRDLIIHEKNCLLLWNHSIHFTFLSFLSTTSSDSMVITCCGMVLVTLLLDSMQGCIDFIFKSFWLALSIRNNQLFYFRFFSSHLNPSMRSTRVLIIQALCNWTSVSGIL